MAEAGKMRVVAVVNQKGGVGKTTVAVNLGHALAIRGLRVLLVDLDPQGHLGDCLGLNPPPREGVDEILLSGADPARLVVPVREGLWLLPAGSRLGDFGVGDRGVHLALALQRVLQMHRLDYDIAVLDSPPAAGVLAVNAMLAADELLVPVAGDYLALTGLARLLLTLKRLQSWAGKGPRKRILRSRFQPRRRLSGEVQARLQQHFGEDLMAVAITEAAALAECAALGRTIFEHRRNSRAAGEFEQLAAELLSAEEPSNEQQETSHVA
jgi:chromosome partitioning protein